jgi:hypothetical protein
LYERLQSYPGLLDTPIEPLPARDVPTVYKEFDTFETIFNEVLLAHFPDLFPPELITALLAAFRAMVAAREGQSHTKHDSRSKHANALFHLGAWKKYCNPLNLTSDTTPDDRGAQEATDAFMQKLEEVADILAPVVESLCPRLMEKLHQ